MELLVRGTRLGDFRIDGVLGRGGMGVVYEARQLSLDRSVALKLIAPTLGNDPALRARFRREALSQAAIEHPHIVPVYEAGDVEDRPYIVMRLIHGHNLKELVRSDAPGPARVIRVLAQVADALATAHEAGLIHRDVKPQNILVGSRDHAYLADFGLTRALGPDSLATLTASGQLLGTFDYLSPEQLEGKPATTGSDVYALAATLYECLTGEVPFPRDSPAAQMFAHLSEAPPRVTDVRPELPAALDETVRRGMSKDPRERPGAVELIAGAVRALDLAAGGDGGGATATRATRARDKPPVPTPADDPQGTAPADDPQGTAPPSPGARPRRRPGGGPCGRGRRGRDRRRRHLSRRRQRRPGGRRVREGNRGYL